MRAVLAIRLNCKTTCLRALEHFCKTNRMLEGFRYSVVATHVEIVNDDVMDSISKHYMSIGVRLGREGRITVFINCPFYNTNSVSRALMANMGRDHGASFTALRRSEVASYMLLASRTILRHPWSCMVYPTQTLEFLLRDTHNPGNDFAAMYAMGPISRRHYANHVLRCALARIGRDRLRDKVLALCMALHPRLGAESSLALLPEPLLEVLVIPMYLGI